VLRWLAVLLGLSTVTGLLAFGIVPTQAVGLAHLLFLIFTALLAASLVAALLRRD
jgi:uncharacterized membrane protein YtjA (UPF0391 family)